MRSAVNLMIFFSLFFFWKNGGSTVTRHSFVGKWMEGKTLFSQSSLRIIIGLIGSFFLVARRSDTYFTTLC